MRSKVLIIVIALVLGGLAAVMAATYLRSARTDIAAQNQPIEVLVATQNLPRGLTSEELVQRKLVESRKVPRQFVSADAISSLRGVENQVLAVPVGAGEQLSRSRFQFPAEAGLAYSVPGDLVAISAAVDEVSGVAGLVKPGDYVMVYATLPADVTRRTLQTSVLIARARVLALGTQVGSETQAPDSGGTNNGVLSGNRQAERVMPSTVTLALTPEEAARLTFAQESGTTRLALLPANGSKLPLPAPISNVVPAQ